MHPPLSSAASKEVEVSLSVVYFLVTDPSTPQEELSQEKAESHPLAVINYLRVHGLPKFVLEYTVIACRFMSSPSSLKFHVNP